MHWLRIGKIFLQLSFNQDEEKRWFLRTFECGSLGGFGNRNSSRQSTGGIYAIDVPINTLLARLCPVAASSRMVIRTKLP
jgi:hypothetical protein